MARNPYTLSRVSGIPSTTSMMLTMHLIHAATGCRRRRKQFLAFQIRSPETRILAYSPSTNLLAAIWSIHCEMPSSPPDDIKEGKKTAEGGGFSSTPVSIRSRQSAWFTL
jgi:hypothetical protein